MNTFLIKIISGFSAISGEVQTSIILPANMAAESAAQVPYLSCLDTFLCEEFVYSNRNYKTILK